MQENETEKSSKDVNSNADDTRIKNPKLGKNYIIISCYMFLEFLLSVLFSYKLCRTGHF